MSKHRATTQHVARAIRRRLAGKVLNPVPGHPVSYPYGVKSDAYIAGHHTGEDHACPIGTPIQAVSWGEVVEASTTGGTWGPAYGSIIVVEMQTWRGTRYRYAYCHLSRIDVEVGERIRPGQCLGRTGATGNVTGPHLHFEARRAPYRYGCDVLPVLVKRRP